MITSISSSAEAVSAWRPRAKWLRPMAKSQFCLNLLLLLALAACQNSAGDHRTLSEAEKERTIANGEQTAIQTGFDLLAALQTNFSIATQGYDLTQSVPKFSGRLARMPFVNSSGIECAPAVLTGNGAALEITLPNSASSREGVLAVIIPDGGLRIVYQSYPDELEAIDLIIPSTTIDWMRAKRRPHFLVTVRNFNALVPGEDRPQLLFQEPGIYQFALMNSIDRQLLEANRTPFRVKAGCVVHWNP